MDVEYSSKANPRQIFRTTDESGTGPTARVISREDRVAGGKVSKQRTQREIRYAASERQVMDVGDKRYIYVDDMIKLRARARDKRHDWGIPGRSARYIQQHRRNDRPLTETCNAASLCMISSHTLLKMEQTPPHSVMRGVDETYRVNLLHCNPLGCGNTLA